MSEQVGQTADTQPSVELSFADAQRAYIAHLKGETTETATEPEKTSAVSTPDARADDASEVQDETPDESAQSEHEEGDEEQERDETGKFKRKSGISRRFAKLTREKAELERQLAEVRSKAQPEVPTGEAPKAAAGDDPEPSADDFDDLRSYFKAQAKWEARQALKEHEVAQTAKQQQEAQKSKQKELADKWAQTSDAARDKYDDFDEALQAASAPQHVLAAIAQSDDPGEVAYYLATHQDEANRIAQLEPMSAALAIGKIDARLAKQDPGAEKEAKKPAPTTKAPAPPKPVTRTAPVSSDEPLDSDPPDVWLRKRRAQLGQKRY